MCSGSSATVFNSLANKLMGFSITNSTVTVFITLKTTFGLHFVTWFSHEEPAKGISAPGSNCTVEAQPVLNALNYTI